MYQQAGAYDGSTQQLTNCATQSTPLLVHVSEDQGLTLQHIALLSSLILCIQTSKLQIAAMSGLRPQHGVISAMLAYGSCDDSAVHHHHAAQASHLEFEIQQCSSVNSRAISSRYNAICIPKHKRCIDHFIPICTSPIPEHKSCHSPAVPLWCPVAVRLHDPIIHMAPEHAVLAPVSADRALPAESKPGSACCVCPSGGAGHIIACHYTAWLASHKHSTPKHDSP